MRKASFTLLLASLIAALSAAATSNALAQNSGVDQYLENPGAAVPGEGGGGGGGSGGGAGGSGGGGPGQTTEPTGSSAGSGTGGTVGAPGTSDAAADGSGAGGRRDNSGSGAENSGQREASTNNRNDGRTDSVLGPDQASPVDDSGSGGVGIILPIVLGLLLLGAIVYAVMRHRRRAKAAPA